MRKPTRALLIAAVIVIVLAVTSLPYLWGYRQDGGRVFGGAVSDGRVAAIERAGIQAAVRGQVLLRDPFDPERMAHNLVAPHLVLMGFTSATLGGEILWGILCLRLLAGLCYLLGIYALVGVALHERTERITSFLVAVFGAGLGWAAPWLGGQPAADESMQATVFLTTLGLPRALVVQALLVLYLVMLLESFRLGRWRYAVIAGVAALVGVLIEPHLLAVLVAVPLLYGVLESLAEQQCDTRVFGLTLLALLVASPAVTYVAHVMRFNPFYLVPWQAAKEAPASVRSVLLAFGLLLPFGAAGLWRTAVRKDRLLLFAASWLMASVALLFVPVLSKPVLLKSAMVPLGVLAGYGLVDLLRRYVLRRRAFAHANPALPIVGFILLVMVTNVLVYVRTFRGHVLQEPPGGYYYVSASFRDAAHWLQLRAGEQDVVLCAPETGEVLPGWSGARVFVGPKLEERRFVECAEAARQFYASAEASDPSEQAAERYKFLIRQRISYVYFGEHERAMGPLEGELPWLELQYDAGGIRIYRFRPESAP